MRDRDPWEVVMNDLWVVVFELGPGRAEESRSEKRCETESSSTFLSLSKSFMDRVRWVSGVNLA